MFAFRSERKRIALQALVRRVSDLTMPNLAPPGDNPRLEIRRNRCFPALVVPYPGKRLLVADAAVALTRDIVDQGMSLVVPRAVEVEDVIVAFWLYGPHVEPGKPEQYLLHAQRRHCEELGGDFWLLGLKLIELVSAPKIMRALQALTLHLLPSHVRGEVTAPSVNPQVPA
jgi:hypothetical protein